METSDTQRWPQFFITRVIGSDDLPDVEILTLPSYQSSSVIPDLEHLENLLLSHEVEEFQTIGGSSIDRGPRASFATLHQVVLDAYVREDMPPWDPAHVQAYAEKIYSAYPVPVMNSPVSGSSLLQMVTATGSGAAFMAAFPHADLGHITIYFLMIGGTRIVLGAADGISLGLKQGLSYLLLKWMGVPTTVASILVVGAGGTAQEIVTAGKLEPGWHFTAVDPSQPMLDLAATKLRGHDLANRTRVHLGYVNDLSLEERFDAATLIGVLHHLPGDGAKQAILRSIAARLKPEAPFVLAGNHYAYASQPLLLAAWGERWRMNGASPDEIKSKLDKILQEADPPHSEEAVALLLENVGFDRPLRFFSSLFWGAWLSRRTAKGH